MARRSWQNPPIKERETAHGREFWIRYRIRKILMIDGKAKVLRRQTEASLGLVRDGIRKAEREKARIMAEVNSECYTLQSQILFKDFVAIWRVSHFRGLRDNSQIFYSQMLDKWILPALGDRQIGAINSLDVGEMFGLMEEREIALSTRKATRSIVRKIFRDAKSTGYLPEGKPNPGIEAEVGISAGNQRVLWTPTFDEAFEIIDKLDSPYSVILETILWTGMRISEALGLKWKSVYLDRKAIVVSEQFCRSLPGRPKSKAGTRILPLEDFISKLGPPGQPEDFVFANGSGGYDSGSITNCLRARLREIKAYHAGNAWHAFRRAHLTEMSEYLNVFDLQQQAGHTSIAMTQRYISAKLEKRQNALREAQGKVVEMRRRLA